MDDTRTERLSLRLLPATMATVRAVASDLSAAAPRPVKPTVGAEYLLTLGARAYERGERIGAEAPPPPLPPSRNRRHDGSGPNATRRTAKKKTTRREGRK